MESLEHLVFWDQEVFFRASLQGFHRVHGTTRYQYRVRHVQARDSQQPCQGNHGLNGSCDVHFCTEQRRQHRNLLTQQAHCTW